MIKLTAFVLSIFAPLCAAEINLSSLADKKINEWESKVFFGKTEYQIEYVENILALKAISKQSASALYLEKRIDLKATPYLNWSWMIKDRLPELNELTKKGDDHVARIYIVIKDGPFIWNTKSINYVWSSSQEINSHWDNPFAGENVKMISVKGKNAKLTEWHHEKRNLYLDLIKQFGDKGSDDANMQAYRHVDAIALMTDTDNSKTEAEAYYGDIIFTKK